MALRTATDWKVWLSDLPLTEEVISKYAKQFEEAEITEEDLPEFNRELLDELNISKPGHRTKILRKAKDVETSTTASTRMIKSDVKLPQVTSNCSPSEFRKFLIDWNIYKSENQIGGSKSNKLLYSACDHALQNSIINGLSNFLEVSEAELIEYIKSTVTKRSNPTIYRLAFQRLNQLEHQTIDQYVDILREKAIDCEFICQCPCQFDYSSYAIRDRLIQGLFDKMAQKNTLSNISALPTLQDVINHTKSIETVNNDVSAIEEIVSNEPDTYGVNAARVSTYKRSARNDMRKVQTQRGEEELCTGCGKGGHSTYQERRSKCPAWGKTCNNCGSRNHFSSGCKRKQSTALSLVAHTQSQEQTNLDLLHCTSYPN